ncbi:MAG: aldehyde dehydrogenase family protein [Pseudomonadota bacterium]
MQQHLKFYINGAWVEPSSSQTIDVINPHTEAAFASVAAGQAEDIDRAVAAAKAAFESYSVTTPAERQELLASIKAEYKKRFGDIAAVLSQEMGAPQKLAERAQAGSGYGHFGHMADVLKSYAFEEHSSGGYVLRQEPIGICGLITPWNWPVNQIGAKVAPALAAGCTMVLKPSEVAPLNAIIITEILHEAGVPAGVFNLVNGDGPGAGAPLSTHPDVDMMSFTGSTRAGVAVAQSAAATVKRVSQELGGKSANIILDDADLKQAVGDGMGRMLLNSGQNCNAPSRMLVPEALHDEAVAIACQAAERARPGDPTAQGTTLGPVVSQVQWDKIQSLIQQGIDEGAQLACGGTGRPDGLDQGYYVKPTVFGRVRNDMTIAREEIFGPVLSIIPYRDEDEAVALANDTPYGLSGYVSSSDTDRAMRVAARLRAGNIHINGSQGDFGAPFGGYKQSGNGREWGEHGLREFLEVKAVFVPQVA